MFSVVFHWHVWVNWEFSESILDPKMWISNHMNPVFDLTMEATPVSFYVLTDNKCILTSNYFLWALKAILQLYQCFCIVSWMCLSAIFFQFAFYLVSRQTEIVIYHHITQRSLNPLCIFLCSNFLNSFWIIVSWWDNQWDVQMEIVWFDVVLVELSQSMLWNSIFGCVQVGYLIFSITSPQCWF